MRQDLKKSIRTRIGGNQPFQGQNLKNQLGQNKENQWLVNKFRERLGENSIISESTMVNFEIIN